MKIKILSVTEVNRYLKKYISGNPILSHLEIEGELSNFKRHSSGHLYFTLKDQNARIACVMFKSNADGVKIDLKDGMKLIASGQISVYERDGKVQLYVQALKQAGIGDLHVKFEAMKEKLQDEGLFDQKNKKPLPEFPSKIVAITSPTGAAIRDILTVVKRRNPLVDVLVYPVRVQGETSKDELVAALEAVNKRDDIDIIIMGRGGGSIEELWSFNEECVARQVAASTIPIISAVGHETDFTITDFVADARAATPSAGAELAVPDLNTYTMELDKLVERSEAVLLYRINSLKQEVKLFHPKQLLMNLENKLMDYHQQLDTYADKMNHHVDKYFLTQTSALEKVLLTLEMHSPIHTLNRGYALLENASSKVVTSVEEVKEGDKISVKLSDGVLKTNIDEVINDGGLKNGSKNI
jgi:exodeoxyribonuclease VII large subunit